MLDNGDKLVTSAKTSQGLASALAKLSVFVAITGLLLYGVLSLVKPQYRSVAQLYIEQGNGQTASRARSKRLVAREMRALKSKALMNTVIANNGLVNDPEFNGSLARKGPLQRVSIMLGLSSDPLNLPQGKRLLSAFADKLGLKRGGDPQTIKIVIRSTDPEKSARLANDYAGTYISSLERRTRKVEPTPNAVRSDRSETALILRLRNKIGTGEGELEALRYDIRAHPFKQAELLQSSDKNIAVDPSLSAAAQLDKEQISQLTTQFILAKADREQAELRAKLVSEMLTNTGEIHSTGTVLNAGLVQRLLIKRSRMERRVADLEVSLLPSHPQLKRLNREMAALQAQIRSEARKAVANLESEALIAAVREKSLKTSLDKLQSAAKPAATVLRVKELARPRVAAPGRSTLGDAGIARDPNQRQAAKACACSRQTCSSTKTSCRPLDPEPQGDPDFKGGCSA